MHSVLDRKTISASAPSVISLLNAATLRMLACAVAGRLVTVRKLTSPAVAHCNKAVMLGAVSVMRLVMILQLEAVAMT